MEIDAGSFEHRFGGIQRLYGNNEAEILRNAHICIIGIGGVGCWIAESMARCGVGEITLIDWDDVCLSNSNRQLHAMNGTVGKSKVDVMADRIALINPACKVNARREFFNEENHEEILSTKFDYVFDAIDSFSAKCLLISACKERKIPIIVSGGAGGRMDPSQIQIADMSKSHGDPLLAKVRAKLRKDYRFPRNLKKKFKVACAFSPEQPLYPQGDGCVANKKPEGQNLKLDCFSGFGTATFITGTFGFAMAGYAVKEIVGKK
ncbi:MAG: tRNA cyclic N6-threonylcarbamoyladenosine(37) synthase TcdA [Lentisphaeraceae bacterium]|nr:tRNA cyclic N6-threonylcarbamoyladenosine(37) synthase TcdA [Lentisphaeraceae bacterium]